MVHNLGRTALWVCSIDRGSEPKGNPVSKEDKLMKAAIEATGDAGGMAAGRAMMGIGKDLPPRICVAVSPDEVYLLGMKAYGYHVDPIAKIHREKLGVEIHQRVSVRTVVLEDLETGHKFPLEVKRLNLYHAKAMVELLMMSDAHHEEEVEEEELEDASDDG